MVSVPPLCSMAPPLREVLPVIVPPVNVKLLPLPEMYTPPPVFLA